jgi:hypothetical protein
MVQQVLALRAQKEENKKCINCKAALPMFVCFDFGTFICRNCRELHHQLGHKTGEITEWDWQDGEIALLRQGGNKKAADDFFAHENAAAFDGKMLDFIRKAYVVKCWENQKSIKRGARRVEMQAKRSQASADVSTVESSEKSVEPESGQTNMTSSALERSGIFARDSMDSSVVGDGIPTKDIDFLDITAEEVITRQSNSTTADDVERVMQMQQDSSSKSGSDTDDLSPPEASMLFTNSELPLDDFADFSFNCPQELPSSNSHGTPARFDLIDLEGGETLTTIAPGGEDIKRTATQDKPCIEVDPLEDSVGSCHVREAVLSEAERTQRLREAVLSGSTDAMKEVFQACEAAAAAARAQQQSQLDRFAALDGLGPRIAPTQPVIQPWAAHEPSADEHPSSQLSHDKFTGACEPTVVKITPEMFTCTEQSSVVIPELFDGHGGCDYVSANTQQFADLLTFEDGKTLPSAWKTSPSTQAQTPGPCMTDLI